MHLSGHRPSSPSVPDPVHAPHLHSDSSKYYLSESGKYYVHGSHSELHNHVHHLEHKVGHHPHAEIHHMLRIHNEAQGHTNHGHFDQYHPQLGGKRPGSAGSRRNSFTRTITHQPSIKVVIDSSTIQKGLHTLGKHPFLMNVCFLGLNLHSTGLSDEDSYLLADFCHVAYVDISRNALTNLEFLSPFSSLVQLNACGNAITDCLNFFAPKCDSRHAWSDGQHAVGSMLTLANLCNNKISLVQDLSHHPFLETLLLKQNSINVISGLTSLRFLKVLDLSYNNIQVIDGLDNLNLEELSLEGNRIQSLSGLERLPRLTTLNAAHNDISSLQPLAGCTALVNLNMKRNKIAIVREVEHLSSLPWLAVLEMADNPCVSKQYFRERVVMRLTQIVRLDHTVVSAEEKIRAFNLYNQDGGDILSRREVFNVVFPNEEFVNTGPSLVDDEADVSIFH